MTTDQKISIDFAACTGCGDCFTLCPTDVFRWDGRDSRPIVAFEGDCSTCFVCQDLCPAGCIVVAEERAHLNERSIYDRLNIPIG